MEQRNTSRSVVERGRALSDSYANRGGLAMERWIAGTMTKWKTSFSRPEYDF
jgi:hypothetical protein